jgi:lipopolysaccharide assembly outer membrane protein LptD (OstA)
MLFHIATAQPIIKTEADTTCISPLDSLNHEKTILKIDSISQDSSRNFTNPAKKLSKNAITNTVTYKSLDSAQFDIQNRVAYLYHEGEVHYETMELTADFISMGFSDNELYASGIATEQGNINGSPAFSQDGTSYRAQEIRYNFHTKKGKIAKVITSEGEGYVHGKVVKKIDDSTLYIQKGKYTTCDLDDPHFEISFNKGKFIKDDKIVTGPAYLSFVGVPTVLAIPFGYFPMEKGRQSGIIMPTFGESAIYGFYFQNFGYYFGINDNIDLLLGGDIYTRGSWAAKVKSNYIWRYVCSGAVELEYAQNYSGERLTPSRKRTDGYKIYWKHSQDPKFHPTTRFNAFINVVSSSYSLYNNTSINDYLSNQYSSSVNFSTSVNGIFFIDAAITYSQNTSTHTVALSLPDLNLSVAQFYPFRKKKKIGALKWYDNISMKWTMSSAAKVNTLDTLFSKPKTWKEMNVGMMHTIPITIPIKIAKAINWNTTLTLTEKWYLQGYERQFHDSLTSTNNLVGYITEDFKRKFGALHDLSLSSSITTRVYFTYQSRETPTALRHVMTPTLNFTFRPNLNNRAYSSYFNTVIGRYETYSYYDNSIYGTFGRNMQALTSFSLTNNLEIKVKSKRDTITGTRKIVLIENLTLNASYDFAADSLNWQMFTISGRTTLFKQLYVTFAIGFDPYCIGTDGRRIHVTELKQNKRLLRFSNSNVSLGLNWTIDQSLFGKKKKKKEEPSTEEVPQDQSTIFSQNTLGMPNRRPDFSSPWSVTLNYTFSYNIADNLNYYRDHFQYPDQYSENIIQTLNVSADFSITKKWKIGITTGYDFTQKDISFTSIDIYRDLHCWEMRFNWIPFGYRKGWSFTINVKASVLQDLKYNMKRDFRDNVLY